jgi:hypothetical protein
MRIAYILQDDKSTILKDEKGILELNENPQTDRHTLTINGNTHYYTGLAGLAAMREDYKQLKEVGFI